MDPRGANKAPSGLTYFAIAAVTHEANRMYCLQLDDASQPEWAEAPDWQVDSGIAGVAGILQGQITTPEQSHESWMAQKVAEGWVWGSVKDPAAKQHPCLVPYANLPRSQRRKDALFFAIVHALA